MSPGGGGSPAVRRPPAGVQPTPSGRTVVKVTPGAGGSDKTQRSPSTGVDPRVDALKSKYEQLLSQGKAPAFGSFMEQGGVKPQPFAPDSLSPGVARPWHASPGGTVSTMHQQGVVPGQVRPPQGTMDISQKDVLSTKAFQRLQR